MGVAKIFTNLVALGVDDILELESIGEHLITTDNIPVHDHCNVKRVK